MKYTIMGFQQSELIKHRLDTVDATILRYIVDFFATGKMYHRMDDDGRIFFWVSYQSVIDELPILGISSAQVLGRRFKRWEDIGLVTKMVIKGQDRYSQKGTKGIRHGTFTYFTFNADFLARLIEGGLDSNVRPSAGGPDAKVQPGRPETSSGAGSKHPTKDPSSTDSFSTDHSSMLAGDGIAFTHEDWVFYADGTARYKNDSREHRVDRLPFRPSFDLMMKIDRYYSGQR